MILTTLINPWAEVVGRPPCLLRKVMLAPVRSLLLLLAEERHSVDAPPLLLAARHLLASRYPRRSRHPETRAPMDRHP